MLPVFGMMLGGGSVVLAPNAAAWNSAAKGATVVLSNSDRTAASNSGSGDLDAVRGVTACVNGQRLYAEFKIDAYSNSGGSVGVGAGNSSADVNSYAGATANSIGYRNNGAVNRLGNLRTISTYTTGDVLMIAVYKANSTSLTVWFGKNGAWLSGDPSAGTGGDTFDPGGDYYLMADVYHTGDQITVNTGYDAFIHSVPGGFSAWG